MSKYDGKQIILYTCNVLMCFFGHLGQNPFFSIFLENWGVMLVNRVLVYVRFSQSTQVWYHFEAYWLGKFLVYCFHMLDHYCTIIEVKYISQNLKIKWFFSKIWEFFCSRLVTVHVITNYHIQHHAACYSGQFGTKYSYFDQIEVALEEILWFEKYRESAAFLMQ